MRKKLLLILFFLTFIIGCSSEKRYSPDGRISFTLTEPHTSLYDTLAVSDNDTYAIIALFKMGDSSRNNNFLFATTRMKGEEEMTIEHAFNYYVKDINPALTTVIEAKSYTKDGKKLYRKISESDFGVKKVRNIMFYFMKDNNSNTLYELKISIAPENFKYGLECIEKMALSVKLQ